MRDHELADLVRQSLALTDVQTRLAPLVAVIPRGVQRTTDLIAAIQTGPIRPDEQDGFGPVVRSAVYAKWAAVAAQNGDADSARYARMCAAESRILVARYTTATIDRLVAVGVAVIAEATGGAEREN